MGCTIGISTQTPLLKFSPAAPEAGPLRGASLDLVPPHQMTPGGVCRMVLPTLRRLQATGWAGTAHWFSLQPDAPETVAIDDGAIALHHLRLPARDVAAYARCKEKLWADIHGLPRQPFAPEDFRFYSRYNAFTADALLQLAGDLDVAYIHDFQLLLTGGLVGLAAPTVFQWHVPVDPKRMPRYTMQFVLRAMEDFDTVVVSCRRDLQGLLDAGFRGRARQLMPYIDTADWPDVTPGQLERINDFWHLSPDTPVVLVVARMDPMKRQDLAIRAFARVAKKHPDARLVLVGNGSFSGSKPGTGGLGLGKADQWRRELEGLTHELRVSGQVLFAHWVPDDLLAAAYARATAVLLPSDTEGFGLTVLETWRYGKVAIVSTGAGAAEVVIHDVNGLTFDPGDEEACASAIDLTLGDEALRERLGDAGRRTLPFHTAEAAAPHVRAILDEAMEGFAAP